MSVNKTMLLAATLFSIDPRVQQHVRTRGEIRGVNSEILPLVHIAWKRGGEGQEPEATWRREAEGKAVLGARMQDAIEAAALKEAAAIKEAEKAKAGESVAPWWCSFCKITSETPLREHIKRCIRPSVCGTKGPQ